VWAPSVGGKGTGEQKRNDFAEGTGQIKTNQEKKILTAGFRSCASRNFVILNVDPFEGKPEGKNRMKNKHISVRGF